jgi:hypothetical protein
MSEDTQASKKKYLILLVTVAAIAAIASSLPSVQNKFKELVFKDDREILAKITSFFGVQQNEYLILKIKDGSGITIEIYERAKGSASQAFKQKFELIQDSDAYITLDRNTTNLALSDVNKDGQLDILAPSVDRNGNLRLNSFQFNAEYNTFEPIQENQ